MVMSFHAVTIPTKPLLEALVMPGQRIGWTGVDVFFVLSGFLVGGLLLKEYYNSGTIDAKRFLARRAFKIWPSYYFYLLFQVVVRRHPLHTFLIANLLHIQNYVGTSLEHTWTLAIEEHFYLALAFTLAFVVGRKWTPHRITVSLAWAIPVIIAVRCATVVFHGHDPTQTTHTRIDSLLFGVLLAALFTFYPDTFDRVANMTFACVVIIAATLIFLFSHPSATAMDTFGFTLLYLAAGAFLLLVYRHSGRIKGWLPYRWVAQIGVYSYGIYLWHIAAREPAWLLARNMPVALRWSVLLTAQFVIAITLGAALTHLVEWPFLRMREKVLKSTEKGPEAASHVPV